MRHENRNGRCDQDTGRGEFLNHSALWRGFIDVDTTSIAYWNSHIIENAAFHVGAAHTGKARASPNASQIWSGPTRIL